MKTSGGVNQIVHALVQTKTANLRLTL